MNTTSPSLAPLQLAMLVYPAFILLDIADPLPALGPHATENDPRHLSEMSRQSVPA